MTRDPIDRLAAAYAGFADDAHGRSPLYRPAHRDHVGPWPSGRFLLTSSGVALEPDGSPYAALYTAGQLRVRISPRSDAVHATNQG